MHWILTMYPKPGFPMESLIENVKLFLESQAQSWVFQHERGALAAEGSVSPAKDGSLPQEDGELKQIPCMSGKQVGCDESRMSQSQLHRDHLQIFVSFKSQRYFNALRVKFNSIEGCSPVHLEKARDRKQAAKYCSKSTTRVSGPWSKGIAQAMLTVDPPRDPLMGRNLHDWQTQVLAVAREEPDDRTIYWFWEPDGAVGKTSLCKHLVLTQSAAYVAGGAKDILYAIKTVMEASGPPRMVLFDIPRSSESRISWQSIEAVKNGLAFSSKYESGTIVFNCPHVFCFSNGPPETDKLSADRWSIHRIIKEDDNLTLDPELRDL